MEEPTEGGEDPCSPLVHSCCQGTKPSTTPATSTSGTLYTQGNGPHHQQALTRGLRRIPLLQPQDLAPKDTRGSKKLITRVAGGGGRMHKVPGSIVSNLSVQQEDRHPTHLVPPRLRHLSSPVSPPSGWGGGKKETREKAKLGLSYPKAQCPAISPRYCLCPKPGTWSYSLRSAPRAWDGIVGTAELSAPRSALGPPAGRAPES